MSNWIFWLSVTALATAMGIFVWQVIELIIVTDRLFELLEAAS